MISQDHAQLMARYNAGRMAPYDAADPLGDEVRLKIVAPFSNDTRRSPTSSGPTGLAAALWNV